MFLLLWIRRNLLRRPISWLASLAVAMLVTLIVVIISVMDGLVQNTKDANHAFAGDVIITSDSLVGFSHYENFIDILNNTDFVQVATPTISSFGYIHPPQLNANYNTAPYTAPLMGIHREAFSQMTGFNKTLVHTEEAPKAQNNKWCIPANGGFGTMYFQDFSRFTFDCQAPFGLTVFALSSSGTMIGSATGEHTTVAYENTMQSELIDVNQIFFVDFDMLQKLNKMDGALEGGIKRCSDIRILVNQGFDLPYAHHQIALLWRDYISQFSDIKSKRLLANVKVVTWKQFRKMYVEPAEHEKSMMILVFAILSVIAVFVIFAIFSMLVASKVKDIGIIKSTGASQALTVKLFLGFGFMVGVIGAICGGCFGSFLVMNSNEIMAFFGIVVFDPMVYVNPYIPSTVSFVQVGFIMMLAVGASIIGALIPAFQAGRLEIVDALSIE